MRGVIDGGGTRDIFEQECSIIFRARITFDKC